jgi:hypothetical protein
MKTHKDVEKDIVVIKEKYGNDFFLEPVSQFYGDETRIGLWFSAEGDSLDPEFLIPVADYWRRNEDVDEVLYEMGFLRSFREFLSDLGYELLEFYDAGTAIAWEG